MPAKSKAQQRLMGLAYAVKQGYMSLNEVGEEYRTKVKELVNTMSVEQLKDFASTPHDGLPDTVESDSNESMGFALGTNGPQSVGMPGMGMGKIALPDMSTGATGSGDKPAGQGDADDEYKKEKKKKKKREKELAKKYKDFLEESNLIQRKYIKMFEDFTDH
jgi:hypothetical protein